MGCKMKKCEHEYRQFWTISGEDCDFPAQNFSFTDGYFCIYCRKREWYEKTCSICAFAEGNIQSEISIEKFKEESENKFGKGIFEAAIKLQAFSNGMNVYSPSVVQAQRYLSKALTTKLISLEQLLVVYNLKITKTYLKKKLDGILAT